MRGALGLAIGAALALGAAACTTSSAPLRFEDAGLDGAPRMRPDATFVDATVDVFDWPDTGPPLPPVLPAQAWVADVNINGQTFEVTFDIDARAEAGTVRVVAGGNGRATSTLFDILPDGLLRARAPIPMGVPGDHTCSYDTFAIAQWSLQFVDHDGDGIHETLASASTSNTVFQTSPTLPPSSFDAFVSVTNIHADTTGPTLSLSYVAPVGGFDPVVVLASEPVAPSFMPRLVGPRTVLLAPDVGASAPARWTAETRGLPPGHYDLVFDTEASDVAGHLAIAPSLPTLAFDVAAPAAPAADDFDPAIVGIFASAAPTVIGDDPSEVALLGSTSLLTVGRTIIVFDSRAGRRTLSMLLRLEGPSTATQITAMISVYDARGVLAGQGTDYQYFAAAAQLPGFDLESPTHTFPVGYVAPAPGRYYAVIQPGGPGDSSCTGTLAVMGIGTVLDQLMPM